MRNYYLSIFFTLTIIFVISCKKVSNEPQVNKDLISIDKIILSNSFEASKELDLFQQEEELSDYDKNYLTLLKIISKHKSHLKIETDSAIKESYNFFSKENKLHSTELTQFNYGRSSIYYGIIKMKLNSQDTTIYPLIRKGQDIISDLKNNNYYNAIANSYLANIYFEIDSTDVFNQYYELAINELSEINDFETIALIKINNTFNYLIKRRYDKVIFMLKEMEDERILINKKIRYAFYNLYATYCATQRDYKNAIKYSLLMKENNVENINGVDNSKIYFSISKYFSFMNQLDSSLIYANMALDYELNEGSKNSNHLHLYFRNIGDIYSKNLEYYKSSVAYRKSYYYALKSVSGFQKKKMQEIERQYAEFLNKSKLEKQATQRWIFILFEIIIMLTLIILASLFIYKYKLSKLKRRHLELKQINLENELKQSKGMIDVVSLSLGILPNFIDKINSLSSKVFSSNPALYDDIQSEINSVKSQTRKRLLDLINSEAFINSNPLIKHLNILSNQEKMIFLLLKQEYSTKYISGILNITQSSIRGSKVKIKSKIEQLDITENDKKELLKGL